MLLDVSVAQRALAGVHHEARSIHVIDFNLVDSLVRLAVVGDRDAIDAPFLRRYLKGHGVRRGIHADDGRHFTIDLRRATTVLLRIEVAAGGPADGSLGIEADAPLASVDVQELAAAGEEAGTSLTQSAAIIVDVVADRWRLWSGASAVLTRLIGCADVVVRAGRAIRFVRMRASIAGAVALIERARVVVGGTTGADGLFRIDGT